MNLDTAALERIEISAIADLYRAAPADMRDAYGIDVREVAGAHCYVCRDFNPTLLFRRVVGLGVARPATPDDVEQVCRYMNGVGQPYCIQVNPQASPAALTGWLEARGFTRGYAWMTFARSTAEPLDAPTDLDVRAIDQSHGEPFGRVVAEGFGFAPAFASWMAALPGRDKWICALAFADGAPLGAGAAYVEGDYAWFGFAATLPAARRRGAQRAILALRLREAAARGASMARVETGERLPDKPSNSYRNILSAGFKEIHLRQNYVSPAKT